MDRDRLIIFVIVRRTDLHCLRRDHKKYQENLIRVQRLQQGLQLAGWKKVRKWWCQIELKIKVCEFCLRKMLRKTEVRNPDRKMKEMKVWQFYVVVC